MPRMFPNGADVEKDSMRTMVLAFWIFLWRKKRPYKSMCLMVFKGICSPINAQIFGWLLGEVHDRGRHGHLVIYCFLLLAINMMYNRAEYVYELDVPLSSVRYELTYRLQRQFLGMKGDTARCWPAGRCAAMLSYDVRKVVNLNWESIFEIARSSTTLIMCTIIMLHNTCNWPTERFACITIFTSLFVGSFLATILRQPKCLDLALRKRDWQLGWMAISRTQIREQREGKERDLDEAAQEVSDAAMVFRRRAFHYYFARLVSALAPAEMAFFAEAMVSSGGAAPGAEFCTTLSFAINLDFSVCWICLLPVNRYG